MKKLLHALALLLCLLSLAGCANGQPAPSDAIASPEAPDAVSADEVAAPAAPAEKTVLRLGMIMSEDGALRNIVSEFNRTDSAYTVELVDYWESTDDQTQAETVLKTQMLSKDGPDMICFTGLSPLPWIAKGLLYDMEPLAAADGELSAETVPIWDALHEYGGLYLLGPTYSLGCTARFYNEHAGWTLRDFIQIESELDEGQQLLYYMSPDYFLSCFSGRYLRSALDLKNAACDLDNEDFIFILDSACKVGTFQDTDDRDRTYAQIVLNDEVFCFFEGLMSAATLRSTALWRATTGIPTTPSDSSATPRRRAAAGAISGSFRRSASLPEAHTSRATGNLSATRSCTRV